MFTLARPLVENVPNRPEGATIALCRYCQAQVWKMPNEPTLYRAGFGPGARPACSTCALRRGCHQRRMDAALTCRVVSVRELVRDPDELGRVIYVGRRSGIFGLAGHPLANPFRIDRGASELDRLGCVERYREWLAHHPDREMLLGELLGIVNATGFPLACWCGSWPDDQDLACHAVVIAQELNRMEGVGTDL